ncbi:MAG: ABC transporter substrate-binding protein [Anaerolineae bacterium]|nr:ABC transporter substrate-binding protein [Anaerolineae bacterium]
MIGRSIDERYRLDGEIGQGGMGTVYRGHDTRLGRDVAIKLMSNSKLGTDGRARLLHEAQATAKLNHTNIVTVHDAGETEEGPYIVMEIVEGDTLHERPPTELEEIVEVGRQICAALEHAHENGIIHRDLKPENVVRDANGTAKLMDFGLARSVASRLTSEGTMMGTVFYMAPEQAMGKEIDGRADLYSLGVMLYELVTRGLPFADEDPVAVITQHLYSPVVPPMAKDDSIPPRLNDLIVQLLSKEPDERPATAGDVREMLKAKDLLDKEAAPAEEVSVLDRIVRGRMVGRRKEFEQARERWNEAKVGKGFLLLISGEPGIGKSRLLREISTHVEVSRGIVLTGTSYQEGGMPYAPFKQIVRQAMRGNLLEGLGVPDDTSAALVKLVPELSTKFPKLAASEEQDPQTEQRMLFEHMTVFFNLLSMGKPLLLALEDAHWADSGSLYLLRHLGREMRHSAVMTAATYREVELHENRAFHEVLLDFNRERMGERLKLTRLDREGSRKMMAALFEEEITDELLDGIYSETEGNPFYIEEVCKALVESGKVRYEGGKWHRPDIEELGIPQSVQVAVQARLDRLDEQAQGVLRQAAVLGREFPYEVLIRAADGRENGLDEVMERARRAQLIEEVSLDGEVGFSFSHALIPATLLEVSGTLERQGLHRRAAEAIEATEPENIEALAYHYKEAGEKKQAVEFLIQAADKARLMYAHQEAIDNYEQALIVLKEAKEWDHAARVQMKLSLAHQNNFDFKKAAEATKSAFELWREAGEDGVVEGLPPAPHPFRFKYVEPPSLDTAHAWDLPSSQVGSMLFSGLVEESPDGDILPDGASKWEISEDGRNYTFYLREDFKWSDGEPVTADDFVTAFKRILDPATNAASPDMLYVIKNAEAFNQGKLNNIEEIGVIAVGDHILEIELEEPTGYFLQMISTWHAAPVPRHAVEEHGNAWVEPDNLVTNGPFRLARWDKGRRMIFMRNEEYDGRFPGNLQQVDMDLTDISTAMQYYKNDEVDIVFSLVHTTLSHREIDGIRQQLADAYITGPSATTFFVAFDNHEPPFDDRRVRQAFALALDKEKLAGEALSGLMDAALGGLIPPEIPGHQPDLGNIYDVEKARSLLAEAGFPGGEGFPSIKAINSEFGDYISIRDEITSQWKEALGVQIDWITLPFAEFLEKARNDRADLWIAGWVASTRDPHYFLGQGMWPSMSRWKNSTYDQIIQEAAKCMDPSERLELYQKAELILAKEMPILPIAYLRGHHLTKPWVKKIPMGPFSIYFKDVVMGEHG